MIKQFFLASVITVAATMPAKALPQCYMVMGDNFTDLSHMCGGGAQGNFNPTVAAANNAPVAEPAEENAVYSLATMELHRAEYSSFLGETFIDAKISFSRSAIVGTQVQPYIEVNGQRLVFEPIVRERSGRVDYVTFRIRGEYDLADIGRGFGFVGQSSEDIAVGLGRSR